MSDAAPHNPLLCLPFRGREELIGSMRQVLAAASHFDPAKNSVGPAESSANPEVALRVRLGVLLRTYDGDYHTDSFDITRLAEQVRSGREAIWFWGHEDEIARLRRLLRAPRAELPDLALGTVTVLSAEDELGEGYGELCRSGSVDRTLGAKAPIVSRTLGYLDGREAWLRDRYHTLVLAPRSRPSSVGVRGGEAIHRIHKNYVRSCFWGYAPFYVMQGGVIEQTEFRESNRDPEEVRAALAGAVPWCFSDEREGTFAAALAEINYGVRPLIEVTHTAPLAGAGRFRVRLPPLPALCATNHGYAFALDGDGGADDGVPAAAAVARLLASGVCCSVVRLRLDRRDNTPFQAWLGERGFRLTGIIPPKRTWIVRDGARRDLDLPAWGLWSRPRPGVAVVQPYYLELPPTSAGEAVVLRYLADRLRFAETPEA